MSTTPPPVSVDKIVIFLGQLVTIRYVTASVYVCLFLEHLAFFTQEVEYIWKAPWNLARILFLLYRYSTIAGLTILMYMLAGMSGPLDESVRIHSCRHAVAAMGALAVLTMGIADLLVMLRVSVLWGRQRVILMILFFSFFITYSTAVVCAVIGATKLVSDTIVIPQLNACIPAVKPHTLLGVWVPGMAFDVLVLTMTSWNACAQPRSQSTALTQALYRDGAAFFVVLAGLRALNLFMTIFSPLYLIGVCISWPLSAITLSRFIFRLHRLEEQESFRNLDFEDEGVAGIEVPSIYQPDTYGQMPLWEVSESRSYRRASDGSRSSSSQYGAGNMT